MTRTVERRRRRESGGRGWEKSEAGNAGAGEQSISQETVVAKSATAAPMPVALASITRVRFSQMEPVAKHAT